MNSPKEILEKLSGALPILKQRYPISYMALFGSVVRPDFDAETSDVDILVDFDTAIGWEFFDLQDELQNLLGRKVDLISRKAVKPHYWEVIKNDLTDVAAAA
jgi:predicted nucleotidyltransferase